MFHTGMAAPAALMINLRMRRQQVFQAPAKVAGDTEVDIGHFGGAKVVDLQLS